MNHRQPDYLAMAIEICVQPILAQCPAPPKPKRPRCRYSPCRARVDRAGDFCSPACTAEHFGMDREGDR